MALSNGAAVSETQWQQLSGPTVILSAGSDAASVGFLSADVASDHTVTLSVTALDENGVYSYAVIDIQLRPFAAFNSPPSVPESLQRVFYSGELVNIVMTATDSDPLTYQWTQTFGETVTLTDNSNDTLSFTTPDTSENMLLGFSLVVSDGTYNIQREVTIGVKRQQDTAGTYYYHNDHLGTPQALTDNSQTVVWQASYTPFGEAAISTDIVENNIRFPGQYYDQESGLHYNYFRDYDPQSGRYIQSDRLGLFDGPNTYGYAHQNPISKYDPTGEFVPLLLGFLVGAGVEYFTNPCADTGDILLAGGLGAFGGGVGARIGLKLAGNKGLNKQFSHFIPERYIRPLTKKAKKPNPDYKPWLDNRLGRWLIKGHNKWNGNYVHVKRHFKHDPFAKGNKNFPGRTLGQKYSPVVSVFNRVPNSWWGTALGIGTGVGTGQSI